jgi:hypothetical protein
MYLSRSFRRTLGAASALALTLTTVPLALAGATPVPVSVPVTQSVQSSAVPVVAMPRLVRPSATAATALARVEYLQFTMDSVPTNDLRGVEDSLYRGDFYLPGQEDVRQCIVQRESEGHYTVRGGGGNRYFGAYQMSDALADGATWMMLKEHESLIGPGMARELMATLREMPANAWPRYWQDAAFSTVYNWEKPGSGAKHWRGGRWSC